MEVEKFGNMLGFFFFFFRLLQLGGSDLRCFINRNIKIQHFSGQCVGHFQLHYFFFLGSYHLLAIVRYLMQHFFHIYEILNFNGAFSKFGDYCILVSVLSVT